MTILTRSLFQPHPFHLVSPSPWPFNTSFSLLILTVSAVLTFQGFTKAVDVINMGLLGVVLSMSLWFRDVISEGTNINNLQNLLLKTISCKAISAEETSNLTKNNICRRRPSISDQQLGHYLAGLLEGDGHLSLPFMGKTILNRVLNPRIVFTSHIDDLVLYAQIQSKLGGIGRFQLVGNNTIRYIIGDVKGIVTFIELVHGKLRTPKNESFNKLIEFINFKYHLKILSSTLDKSDLSKNSWLSGFTESDGQFGLVIRDLKPKSETRKRSFLSGKVHSYKTKDKKDFLCVYISKLSDIKFIISYFNKHPLHVIKYENFKKWETVYNMILCKEHLSDQGRSTIKLIQSNMNSKKEKQSYLTLNTLKSSFSPLFLFLILILSINYLDLYHIFDINYLCMAKDAEGKGTVEINNVNITGFEVAVGQIRDGAVYIGGMAAAGKIVKNCSLPIGAKLGATVGIGAALLIAYKMVQNNVSPTKTQGKISMSAEKVSGNGSVSPKNNFVWENFLNNNNNSENKTIYNISTLDVQQLKLDYHLQIIILYLLILVLIFLVIKFISDKNLNSNYIEKLPLNK